MDQTEAAVSSKANFAGEPSSWLEADTMLAPAAVEARFGASETVFAAFLPAAMVKPSIVWVPKPGAWMVSG